MIFPIFVQQLSELSWFFLDKISGQQNVRLMSSDDDSMDATNSDTFIDDGTTKNDITEKSPSKTENGKKAFKNRSEIKPIKRAPRTSVIMKKLAKLEEKERLKNIVTFSCDHCSSKFTAAGNLNKHLKNKHNLGSVGKRGPKSKDTEDSSSDVTEFCENIDLQPTVEKEEASKSKKTVTLKMENCGDFETIVTVTNNVYTPSAVDTPERKRGRGRPPKHKSTDINDKDENVSTTKHIPASKQKKDIAEEPEDPVVTKSQKDPVVMKSPKSDIKATKTPAKPNYTDDDLACFVKTHDDGNTKMNLECKLCLLRFSSQQIVWDHVLNEHRLNVEQCVRTLDLYPDTTKSSRFDSYIYVIEDDTEESIFPADLFNTTGRAGRKRTPSKKLLESQIACSKTSYVCKICHRKGTNKTSILKHMTKFHMDILPASETKEDGEEEDMEEGEVEEEEEEEDIVNEEDDEDQDYKPSHEPVDEVRKDEDSVKIARQKSIKRKKNVQIKSHQSKRNRNEGEDSDTVEKEVHVKIEVMPENNVNDQTEELKDDSDESEMKVECNLDEETGEMVPKTVKARNKRSRSKVFKKPPSYYVYCDHDESVIEKKSAHELPFCKSCERFKCLQCTLTFKKISHLNRHVRIIHNKEKKYKCAKCDARFTTNESLSYHKKWHTGVKDVECPHCELKFLVQKNLRKHMNKHHPGLAPIRKKKANHCEICNSVFSRKERLEYHMLEKHPANNPDRECRICGQKFETDEECFSHANAHSDMAKVPVAKCPHCDLYCSSKNNLKRHVDRVHLNIKKYLCNECGKRFKGRDAFIYHVKRHADPHGRDFECHICNKQIATEKGLEIHLRTHTGLKPYVCETCGKGFAQKGNMQSHQAIHVDDRPFECEECHKTFKKKFDLYKHMKRHKIKHVHQTGDLSYLEGAGKVYECPLEDCKVLFCSTNDLKLHLRKHNNEKPYECIICFKTFAVKSRLVRHLRNVHTLHVPDSDLDSVKSTWAQKLEVARMEYKEKKEKYQTVMIPQPSGEQIEVQIMTDEHEGVEDLLALSTPTTFSKEKVKEREQEEMDESEEQQEIQFKIESAEEEGSNIQIINVRENSSGEVQIHTEEENIILDPAIIQTLLNSGQQTIYYYVDQ